MTIEELQAQVQARWAERDLPSWPSTRPPMDAPREEVRLPRRTRAFVGQSWFE